MMLPRSELPDASEGKAVTFIVSTENMQMSRPDCGQTGIAATVAGEEFIGGSAMVFLEAADGREIKLQKSHGELTSLALHTGLEVVVQWAPESCHVLPGEHELT